MIKQKQESNKPVSDSDLEYYSSLVDTFADLAEIPKRAEDWGSGRGQGKRVGRSVLGAMGDPPKGIKLYTDYRNAKGVTAEVWEEIRVLISCGYEREAEAVIGAIQGGLEVNEAMMIGYSRVP